VIRRHWDARTYDRVSGPQDAWAVPVLDRLGLRGDETVLDYVRLNITATRGGA
jgi:hypothetical protein